MLKSNLVFDLVRMKGLGGFRKFCIFGKRFFVRGFEIVYDFIRGC